MSDAGPEDIANAARAARKAQSAWGAGTARERAEICHAIADLIDERREEMAHELTLEQGKPYAAEDVKRMETAVIPSQDANKQILTFRNPRASTRQLRRGTSPP